MKKTFFKMSFVIVVITLAIFIGSFAVSALGNSLEPTIPVTENTHETVTFEEYFGSNSKLDTSSFKTFSLMVDASAFDKLQYEVPEATPNLDRLNVEYSLLTSKMNDMGYGTEYKIDVPDFKKGYSSNISNYFFDTFGDTSSKKGEVATMPKGWTVTSIMELASEQRNVIANSYKDSPAYKEMSTVMNTSDIFSTAKKTMTMPQNVSLGNLASQLSEYSFSVGGNASSIENAVKGSYNSNANGLNKVGSAENSFNDYKGTIGLWVSKMQPSSYEIINIADDALDKSKLMSDISDNFNTQKDYYMDYFGNDDWEEFGKNWFDSLGGF